MKVKDLFKVLELKNCNHIFIKENECLLKEIIEGWDGYEENVINDNFKEYLEKEIVKMQFDYSDEYGVETYLTILIKE